AGEGDVLPGDGRDGPLPDVGEPGPVPQVPAAGARPDLERDASSPLRRPDRSRAERGVAEGACLNALRPIEETRSLHSLRSVGTTGESTPTHPALADQL